MTYLEGFVIPVPKDSRDAFIRHASTIDAMFMENGARRVVEAWPVDVPKGAATDFYRAIDAQDNEVAAFAWVEWADQAARTKGMTAIEAAMDSDPRWDREKNPVPFDGKRMIFGCFEAIVEEGVSTPGSHIQGFVVPVPEAKREAYRAMAREAWPWFHKHGALRVVEGWPVEVKHGQWTDFYRTVKAEDGEVPIFSFIEWPSKQACDRAQQAMMSDPEMKMPDEMPFDGKRMIFGGFETVVRLGD